jgi:hypothetical protein
LRAMAMYVNELVGDLAKSPTPKHTKASTS